MTKVHTTKLPPGTLLEPYSTSGAYTDCYSATLEGQVSLAEFMGAFYTTPIFKLERWLLSRVLRLPSTDQEAHLLAHGEVTRFSAWRVEARQPEQVILAAGRTRSWLMASGSSTSSGPTALYFGTAVVPRKSGRMGWQFGMLLRFHKLYSRVLLGSALRCLQRRNS